ncbi:MAG: PAS domain S-box protein [Ignavibacteriae bacterium]|nr:PAS domain S-box protein [Ignavibacteriota bacterium]
MQTTITEFWWIFSIATSVYLTLAIGFISVTMYSQKRFIKSQEEKYKLLRENEERFRAMVEYSPVPTAVLIGNVFMYVNKAVVEVLGTSFMNDVLGKSVLDFVEEKSREHAVTSLSRFTGKQLPLETTELKMKRLDEKIIDTEISSIPILYSDVPAALLIIHDITKTKEAEAQLKDISRKIIDAQEAERMRFSRELHDGVNQTLFIVKGHVETVERKTLPLVNNGIKNLSHILDPLRDAMKEIQRISRNLRPSSLDDFGLGAAVRSKVEDFCTRTQMRAHLTGLPSHRLAPEIELALFRITQEAFNNIEKHSYATNIYVNYEETDSTIILTVSDDGVGINMERLAAQLSTSGVGMTTMKERAKLIGGSFAFSSAVGKGTTIVVQTPKRYPVEEPEEL